MTRSTARRAMRDVVARTTPHRLSTSMRSFSSSTSLGRTALLPQHTTSKLPSPLLPLADRPETVIPALRVLDSHGKVLDDAKDLDLGLMQQRDFARRVYEIMLGLPQLDVTMSNIQRQGRIPFYMTSYGEEAAVVCSAAAWNPTDEIFAQYREQGVLLWRGWPLDSLMAQCFGTANDTSSRGRQMPIHYSSRALHFHAISSPLATQLPQAAGAAYAMKRLRERFGGGMEGVGGVGAGEARMEDCAVCYFGEGAASEGDFHSAMNMASVLGGPLVFFVRNNGFAISTPATQQYRGDGIAARAIGYGMDTIRVDGNDPVAVYVASREAKRRAIQGDGSPILVEALTYRVGHHSTSDDSSAYRSKGEVEHWKLSDNPLHRMRMYLQDRGWWSDAEEDTRKKQWKDDISAAVRKAEKDKRPPISSMWDDTFETIEPRLMAQKLESEALLKKWGAFSEYKQAVEKHLPE